MPNVMMIYAAYLMNVEATMLESDFFSILRSSTSTSLCELFMLNSSLMYLVFA